MTAKTKQTSWLIMMAAIVVIVAGMKMAESLLVPFMLSVFIALICSPPLAWLKAKGVPAGVAITLIVLMISLGAMVVGVIVGSSINEFRSDIPEYQQKITQLLASSVSFLGDKGIELDMEQVRSSFNPGVVMQIVGNTFASISNLMTNFFMILLTVVFILAEELSFSDKLARARGSADDVIYTLKGFADTVNRYLGFKTLVSLLTGFLVFLWLWIQGVDYPFLWAMLAFLLNFIPTVGSLLAAVPAVLLSLVQLGPAASAITAVGYLLVNFLVGNVLEPRVMGKGLNLSPLVVFLSLVIWGWILGPVGMLLSVPLTIVVKIILEQDEKTRWLAIMLGGTPQNSEKGEAENLLP
jgi:predicted PurR-regulated permease PerM